MSIRDQCLLYWLCLLVVLIRHVAVTCIQLQGSLDSQVAHTLTQSKWLNLGMHIHTHTIYVCAHALLTKMVKSHMHACSHKCEQNIADQVMLIETVLMLARF